ncbi:MAG TPA: prolipoprotein diacylglyceryl transferase [Oceanipulchritudo sp.]|nr:prolipoprotein diacylglyceryl transferase [Oceanipulchritudo sp.]
MEPSGSSHWVHNLDPVIIQFTETLAIRWYGLAYVAGFLVGFGLLALYWKRRRSLVNPQMQESLAIAIILGVVIGGRLGYFLMYEFRNFLGDPLVFFRVWEGGMASHGGFLGVAVAGLWAARKYQINPLYLGDLIASGTPPGILFGRLANFINGELWGKVSDVPWAVVFPHSSVPGMPIQFIPPRHPSQLYEAALEGLLLLVYVQWRFWRVPGRLPLIPKPANPSARPGHLMAEFLIGYSIVRWIGESFREPDAALILGISRGSFYSIFLLIAGISFLYWIRRGQLTKPQSQ